MAVSARPTPARVDSWRYGALLVAGLLALGVLLRVTDPAQIAAVQNFFLVFGSLLIEAMPFILLGAVVSAAIEVFVPQIIFERLALLPRPLQLPVSGLAGAAFPVCECGSIPVARRLLAKGLSPAAAVTFMLAAPILNPVVLASRRLRTGDATSSGRCCLGGRRLGWCAPWRSDGSCQTRPASSCSGPDEIRQRTTRISTNPDGRLSSGTSPEISCSWAASS